MYVLIVYVYLCLFRWSVVICYVCYVRSPRFASFGISLVFIHVMVCISVVRSLCVRVLCVSLVRGYVLYVGSVSSFGMCLFRQLFMIAVLYVVMYFSIYFSALLYFFSFMCFFMYVPRPRSFFLYVCRWGISLVRYVFL